MVIATQNPVEHHGTYPLPESQLDRFLMRIRIGYPGRRRSAKFSASRKSRGHVETVITGGDLDHPQEAVQAVAVEIPGRLHAGDRRAHPEP